MKFNASEAPQEKYVKVKKDFANYAQVPFGLAEDKRVRDEGNSYF